MKRVKRAFILTETLVSAFVFILIISFEIRVSRPDIIAKMKDKSVIDKVSSEITLARIKGSKGFSSELFITADGKIGIKEKNSIRFFNTGEIEVYSNNVPDSYSLTKSFKLMSTRYGNSGFTLRFIKNGKTVGSVIFQVGTSAVRKQYGT